MRACLVVVPFSELKLQCDFSAEAEHHPVDARWRTVIRKNRRYRLDGVQIFDKLRSASTFIQADGKA